MRGLTLIELLAVIVILSNDETVNATGKNDFGQLGDNTTINKTSIVTITVE